MKQLKAKRLVTFSGQCSTWSDSTSHQRAVEVARRLEEFGLSEFVHTTELAPTLEISDERVKLEDRTYYATSGPTLVNDDDFQKLKKAGVKDLVVVGIYEDQSTSFMTIAFWTLFGTFISWNVTLILKVAGLV